MSNAQRAQLEVEHVGVRFDTTWVIEDVCLVVERGEIVVVIGGSGAGKTTLMKTMIGLIAPTLGAVYVQGNDISHVSVQDLRRIRRKFGMVFQQSALLDSLNVFDNVALPLREHTRLSPREIEARVRDKLQALGLKGAELRLPAELSGGMRKRVGLARALILDPSIVMYDEPTSGLDPITARMVDDLIKQTRDTFEVTSVVISHDMVQALHIADRLYVLDRGRVVASGPPQQLRGEQQSLARRFFEASGVG